MTIKKIVAYLAPLATLALPAMASAQDAGGGLEMAITAGFYISTIGFVLAVLLIGLAMRQYGSSAIGTVLTYLFIGTAIFLAVTIFQTLGGSFFGISDDSMDVWWHILFYMALISFYIGLRGLVALGTSETFSAGSMMTTSLWGIISGLVVVLVFVLAGPMDSVVSIYNASTLSQLGLHHFLAFLLAATVGSYLFTAKKSLGQIGRAIANPMIIAIWALGLQHFWELQVESWKTIQVTSAVGEGGEKIFLTITGLCIAYVGWRLYSFAKGK